MLHLADVPTPVGMHLGEIAWWYGLLRAGLVSAFLSYRIPIASLSCRAAGYAS